MNQKNSLGLDSCFMDLDDPLELFKIWMSEAEKKEINDPNALSLATTSTKNEPSVRMILLKGLSQNGFVFYIKKVMAIWLSRFFFQNVYPF